MRVVVTGGSGKVGKAVMKSLRAAGHKAHNFDIHPSSESGPFTHVDCSDFGQVMGALSGIDMRGGVPDAVIHLGAIPGPTYAPDHTIFEQNTISTYNIFSACSRLGIKRIAWASSETILGLPFTTPPEFVPVDETHPDRPEWSYSLSKKLGEEMAKQFVRWSDMSIMSMRFSNVFSEQDYETLPQVQAKPNARKFNLWGYVDARDAADACRLAIESDVTGHEAFIIAAADTIVDIPSAELVSTHYPSVPVKGEIEGYVTLLSIEKTKRMLGYEPKYSWRDYS